MLNGDSWLFIHFELSLIYLQIQMSNYKNYSLKHLEACIQDCVGSDARPHEIYETIRNTIVDTINYHEVCLRDSKELLSLLSGSNGFDLSKTPIDKIHDDILEMKTNKYNRR